MHGFDCALTSNRIWKHFIGLVFDFVTATAVLVDHGNRFVLHLLGML